MEILETNYKIPDGYQLGCMSCDAVFTDVVSAADHTVECDTSPVPFDEFDSVEKKAAPSTVSGLEHKLVKKRKAPPLHQKLKSKRIRTWTREYEASMLACMRRNMAVIGHARAQKGIKHYTTVMDLLTIKMQKTVGNWLNRKAVVRKWLSLLRRVRYYDSWKESQVPLRLGYLNLDPPEFYNTIKEIEKGIDAAKQKVLESQEAVEKGTMRRHLEEKQPDKEDSREYTVDEDNKLVEVLELGESLVRKKVIVMVLNIMEQEVMTMQDIAQRVDIKDYAVELIREHRTELLQKLERCSLCHILLENREELINHELECSDKTRWLHNKYPPEDPEPGPEGDGFQFHPATVEKLVHLVIEINPKGNRKNAWKKIAYHLAQYQVGITARRCNQKWRNLVCRCRSYAQLLRWGEHHNFKNTRPAPEHYDSIMPFLSHWDFKKPRPQEEEEEEEEDEDEDEDEDEEDEDEDEDLGDNLRKPHSQDYHIKFTDEDHHTDGGDIGEDPKEGMQAEKEEINGEATPSVQQSSQAQNSTGRLRIPVKVIDEPNKAGQIVNKMEAFDKIIYKTEDAVKIILKPEASGRITHKAEDVVKIIHKAEDAVKVIHKPEDAAKIIHKAEDAVKIIHKAEDAVKIIYKAEDAVKKIYKTKASGKIIQKANGKGKQIDKAKDTIKKIQKPEVDVKNDVHSINKAEDNVKIVPGAEDEMEMMVTHEEEEEESETQQLDDVVLEDDGSDDGSGDDGEMVVVESESNTTDTTCTNTSIPFEGMIQQAARINKLEKKLDHALEVICGLTQENERLSKMVDGFNRDKVTVQEAMAKMTKLAEVQNEANIGLGKQLDSLGAMSEQQHQEYLMAMQHLFTRFKPAQTINIIPKKFQSTSTPYKCPTDTIPHKHPTDATSQKTPSDASSQEIFVDVISPSAATILLPFSTRSKKRLSATLTPQRIKANTPPKRHIATTPLKRQSTSTPKHCLGTTQEKPHTNTTPSKCHPTRIDLTAVNHPKRDTTSSPTNVARHNNISQACPPSKNINKKCSPTSSAAQKMETGSKMYLQNLLLSEDHESKATQGDLPKQVKSITIVDTKKKQIYLCTNVESNKDTTLKVKASRPEMKYMKVTNKKHKVLVNEEADEEGNETETNKVDNREESNIAILETHTIKKEISEPCPSPDQFPTDTTNAGIEEMDASMTNRSPGKTKATNVSKANQSPVKIAKEPTIVKKEILRCKKPKVTVITPLIGKKTIQYNSTTAAKQVKSGTVPVRKLEEKTIMLITKSQAGPSTGPGLKVLPSNSSIPGSRSRGLAPGSGRRAESELRELESNIRTLESEIQISESKVATAKTPAEGNITKFKAKLRGISFKPKDTITPLDISLVSKYEALAQEDTDESCQESIIIKLEEILQESTIEEEFVKKSTNNTLEEEIAQESTKNTMEEEIVQESSKNTMEEDIVQESIRNTMEDEIVQESTKNTMEEDIVPENTRNTMEEETVQESTKSPPQDQDMSPTSESTDLLDMDHSEQEDMTPTKKQIDEKDFVSGEMIKAKADEGSVSRGTAKRGRGFMKKTWDKVKILKSASH